MKEDEGPEYMSLGAVKLMDIHVGALIQVLLCWCLSVPHDHLTGVKYLVIVHISDQPQLMAS